MEKKVKSGDVGTIFSEISKRASRGMGMSLGLSLGNSIHPKLQNESAVLAQVLIINCNIEFFLFDIYSKNN